MKYLIPLIAFIFTFISCEHGHGSHGNDQGRTTKENVEEVKADPTPNFPVVGFKKVHEEIIPFPLEKVFPLFEPKGRPLLYENWNPTVLREGKDGSLKGHVEFSKYGELDVFLTVTAYKPEEGHIQYLAVWDDFEIQRIDIFCTKGETDDSTKFTWVEYNAGLYEKGVSLVSKFVTEGYLVEAVKRYVDNVEKQLENEK